MFRSLMCCPIGDSVKRTLHLTCLASAFLVAQEVATAQDTPEPSRPNILLITADDLHYTSLGVNGCTVDEITPNLDRLAAESLCMQRAHVNVAICQCCRQTMMTGRYPHNFGAIGHDPISTDVPTLQESLHEAGYYQGILAKVRHLEPREKYCWDMAIEQNLLARGRSARLYYEHATRFFEEAKESGGPFFLMANSQDPHRPFAQGAQIVTPEEPVESVRSDVAGDHETTRWYHGDQIDLPGFLPDLPNVRLEVAQYFTSVHRCDEIVGELLRALDESGMADNTMVIFMSDHGMALPFSKTNCWDHSTHTPLMIRWPNVTEPGSVDDQHHVSTIDFMPTLLEAAQIEPVPGMDGRTFLPLLSGGTQEDRDEVYTMFYKDPNERHYQMRCIRRGDFSYIYNFWSDGETVFHNESQNRYTMRAMRGAARTDEAIAERVQFFLYRVPQELYNYREDPDAKNNLIDDPAHQELLNELRQDLLQHMRETDDPMTEEFVDRLSALEQE